MATPHVTRLATGGVGRALALCALAAFACGGAADPGVAPPGPPVGEWELTSLRGEAPPSELSITLSVEEGLALEPARVILSPGPKRPEDAGLCLELIGACAERGLPLLGVCLGHQAIALRFGGAVREAQRPLHGRATPVRRHEAALVAVLPDLVLHAHLTGRFGLQPGDDPERQGLARPARPKQRCDAVERQL